MDKSKLVELSHHLEGFPTFSEILNYTSEQSPDRIFLIEGERQWTYQAFNELVNQGCRYLADLGLQPGDIISIILKNSVEYLALYFAALRSRIVLSPFPLHLSGHEILSKVEIIAPKALFCHKSHFTALADSQYTVKNIDDLEGQSFLDKLAGYLETSFLSPEIEDGQTAMMYYSSGTTGSPKIIEYTYRSMVLNQAAMLRSDYITPGSTHLCFLPLGHTAALRYTIKPCVCTGSTVVLYESFWKLRTNLWDEIERYQATFMQVVPTILITILNTPYPQFRKEQITSMEFVGCGSSFLPKHLQDTFEKRFGILLSNQYGLSEIGTSHFDNPKEPGRQTGNIGRPFDIIDVKFFDDNRNEVKAGELGEIGIKGPNLLKGYYQNPALFEDCVHNGYFLTGDLGRVDEHGIYYYIDRKKDLIIKGGINIAPSQIDEILVAHPAIEEVATIGKPDLLLGETIKSFLIPKQGQTVDLKELQAYCKEKLGDFKTPSEFEIVKELPKGSSGKILKRALREKEFKVQQEN